MLLITDAERIVGGLNRDPGLRQQLAAGLGQLHPKRQPQEQLLSDLLLEFLNLARQRRLGDEQPGRGTADLPLFRYHHKRAKMPKIDRHAVSIPHRSTPEPTA